MIGVHLSHFTGHVISRLAICLLETRRHARGRPRPMRGSGRPLNYIRVHPTWRVQRRETVENLAVARVRSQPAGAFKSPHSFSVGGLLNVCSANFLNYVISTNLFADIRTTAVTSTGACEPTCANIYRLGRRSAQRSSW